MDRGKSGELRRSTGVLYADVSASESALADCEGCIKSSSQVECAQDKISY